MTNPIDLGFARSAHRMVKQADEALNLMVRSEQRELSLVDIMQGLEDYQCVSGFAAEALAERAHVRGVDFDPRCPTIPWSLAHVQKRAPLGANLGAADGGYLVSTETESSVLDVLRPTSLAVQCGVTVYEGLKNNAILPKVNGDVSGEWLTGETTGITEAEPTFVVGPTVTPHTAGFVVRFTRQLAMQAPNMELFLRTVVARAAGQAVDTAALIGSGSAGAPLGLLNSVGIGTQSGTSYSHANSLATRETLAGSNVNDGAIAWLASPDVRAILAARERAAGDKFMWSGKDKLTGRAARVTSLLPAQTLICGDFANLAICLFGDGFQIDTTGFQSASDFQAGISAMRLMVSLDIAVLHAGAFISIASVT